MPDQHPSPGLAKRRELALADSADMGDPRTAAARRLLVALGPAVPEVWGDLFDCAVERHRINAGLVTENRALRDRLAAPPEVDLTEVPAADLLAELNRRLVEAPYVPCGWCGRAIKPDRGDGRGRWISHRGDTVCDVQHPDKNQDGHEP